MLRGCLCGFFKIFYALCVMPVGSGHLRVGPVPVNVEAKGRDWTVESDTLPTPDRSLVGTRSVYLLCKQ